MPNRIIQDSFPSRGHSSILGKSIVKRSQQTKRNSAESSELFTKRTCNACQELDISAVLARTDPTLGRDRYIAANGEDLRVLLQRILFGGSLLFVQDCPTCHELEKASDEFRFSALSQGECNNRGDANLGRNGNFFEFRRSDRLIAHHSYTKGLAKVPSFPVWTVIEYFGIATSTPFPPSHPARSYSAREVFPCSVNYPLLIRWLDDCSGHHEACKSRFSSKLTDISLIDVESRWLIAYPQSSPVDYLTLSYVWGDATNKGTTSEGYFKPGPLRNGLPATIEDAIQVTRQLKKRYLWVDYVCIDQQDETKKAGQIMLMDDIYSGAFATIISLNGQSMHEGLPRVGMSAQVIPQDVADFGGGNKLVGVMRSLSDQLRGANWMTRGWTFQEGLLSNRRLIFARNQVYFLCNTMSCAESSISYPWDGPPNSEIDDFRERWCILSNDLVLLPAVIPSWEKQRVFESIVRRYVLRRLSNKSDALHAVSGLLKRLQQQHFPEGFYFGLQRRNFRYSLLWKEDPASITDLRYEGQRERRNPNFPSWSWVGWEWAKPVKWIAQPWCMMCNWCRIPQPPLSLCSETGAEIKDEPDRAPHCPEARRSLVKVPRSELLRTPQAVVLEVPSFVLDDIDTVFEGLMPLEQVTFNPVNKIKYPGLLTVQGIVLHLKIALHVCTWLEPTFDDTGGFLLRSVSFDKIELSAEFYGTLGRPSFEIHVDKVYREFLVENEAKSIDFLLVAFSYNTFSGSIHKIAQDDEIWPIEREEENYKMRTCFFIFFRLNGKEKSRFEPV